MKIRSTIPRLAALAVASTLVLAACGGDDGGDGDTGSNTEDSSGPAIYMVDGNTSDYSDDNLAEGTLEGAKATYPGAELGDEFRERMLQIDDSLKDFTYGPESYDAVIVVALATIAAGNDAGRAIAQEMQAVSAEGTACTTFVECSGLLADGEDIDYNGVSGNIEFNSTGSPTSATIGIFEYGADNTYTPVEYIDGEVEDTGEVLPGQEIVTPIPKGNGVLKIGTILPETGDLAFLGPPEFAGVDLAIQINDAGGVLGKPVETTQADSGDGTPNIAPASADKLLNANVDVVLGAASSGVSSTFIDKVTAAGVLQISPANTSTLFDTYKDRGLYFRTAPSDVLQGSVMAQELLKDGQTNVALLVRQDPYGVALAENVKKYFEEGGGTIVADVKYDPAAATFTAEVAEIAAEDPDAIVLITFDEFLKIIPTMSDEGLL
jgi:ABC-type branched-subunit amino acid transport system substrate-binding protein